MSGDGAGEASLMASGVPGLPPTVAEGGLGVTLCLRKRRFRR